ncbi:MAG: hypothetical protein LBJ45_01515, partial [Holosporaceae bacterium]|nr:hypothetical protein [Holosporaceae bacterium]
MKNIPSKIISYLILSAILSLMCGCILWEANWVFNGPYFPEDWQFLSTTAVGIPSRAWTGSGRFWPLGLCDYSILLLFP